MVTVHSLQLGWSVAEKPPSHDSLSLTPLSTALLVHDVQHCRTLIPTIPAAGPRVNICACVEAQLIAEDHLRCHRKTSQRKHRTVKTDTGTEARLVGTWLSPRPLEVCFLDLHSSNMLKHNFKVIFQCYSI